MNRAQVAEHLPGLRRYARVLTADAWAADDLVQDTLERACRKWLLWRTGSDLRAWLFTLMHHLYLNQRRAPVPHAVALEDVQDSLQAPAGGRDDAIDLERCLQRLPPEQRAVLLLVTLEDMAYEDAARVLAIPVGTVMSRLSRARARLRELMAAQASAPPPRTAFSAPPQVNTATMQAPRPTPSFDEQELHAYADGRMAPAEAAALRARLAQAPQAHAQASDWQRQRQQLRALHPELLSAPVPGALQALAAQVDHAAARQSQWWRWGGMAASVLLAFALGWVGRGGWPPGAARTLAAAPAPIQGFAHQAALAYAVYQPEQRHPVEVAADQQAHLVQWLSKRLERPLKLPVLSAEGYELVGGRLLPGDAGARAQFMYQDRTGQRITLYLGAVPGAAQTAFRFTDDGPVPGFYWTDQGFGYALSGPLPRAALLRLATAVHRQL